MNAKPVDRWYVTAVSTKYIGRDARTVKVPHPVGHAKQLGTVTTACGLASYNWHGFLNVGFPPQDAPSCEVCRLVVARQQHEFGSDQC